MFSKQHKAISILSTMAFRATMYWRSMVNGLGGGNRAFATSTTPNMKHFAPTMDAAAAAAAHDHPPKTWSMKAEFAPVYVVMGLVLVAVSMGAHTAKQQLLHSPAVRVNKKKRETLAEVEYPDQTIASADKFINKSFLRKVAHVQDHQTTIPNSSRPDPFTRPRNAETLKSVGVEPSRHY